MNRKCLIVACGLFGAVVSSTAIAAEGLYIRGYGGATFVPEMSWLVPTFAEIKTEQDVGYAIGGAIGYDFGHPRFEFDLGYQDNGFDQIEFAGLTDDLGGNLEAATFMVNAFYDFEELAEYSFVPYVGVGAGIGEFTLEGDEDVLQSVLVRRGDNSTAFTWQVGGGIAYLLNKSVSLDVAYRFYVADDLEFSGQDVDFTSHNLTFGVRYNF